MLQKIASICSIGSFLAAIYIIFAGNLEWQWYSLLGISLFFIIVALVDKKHRLAQPGKIMTLEGIQPLPYSPNKKIEIEVFYPKTPTASSPYKLSQNSMIVNTECSKIQH